MMLCHCHVFYFQSKLMFEALLLQYISKPNSNANCVFENDNSLLFVMVTNGTTFLLLKSSEHDISI